MKDFRTELNPSQSAFPIALTDNIFTIGSCFADTINQYLQAHKFSVGSFFGTVYNPVSIHQLLLAGLRRSLPVGESYAVSDGIHVNYQFHSSFAHPTHSGLAERIEQAVSDAHRFLRNANRIIITYGTAFVYRQKDSGTIVANCHKMPASNFTKTLLSEAEIVESFGQFHSALKEINPACKIIVTLSPVRHLKDTLELNAVSKSIVRVACQAIVNQWTDVEYFPAYEILLDDLRDYRFYKTDRLHPTDEATEYVLEKFASGYFDKPTQHFISEWATIRRDLDHRPFHPGSESHQKFVIQTLGKLEKLQTVADVSEEIREVKSRLTNNQMAK